MPWFPFFIFPVPPVALSGELPSPDIFQQSVPLPEQPHPNPYIYLSDIHPAGCM
jgi:hypothetical protein